MARLNDEQLQGLVYDWPFWARPQQLAPAGDWLTWLILAGRGFGKTRTGAEWVRGEVEAKRRGRLALIAPTAADTRDVMVEGESGILAKSPPWNRPKYEPSKRRLTWESTGAMATLYSADEPERLRGPQHDGFWADEICSWRYPDAWDMMMFGLRLGLNPRGVATTTPKPIKLLRELLKQKTTHVTRGSTVENLGNLAATYDAIIAKYSGTRLGRQELEAEILEDTPGALWTTTTLEKCRVTRAPELQRVVIGVDPSVTNNEGSAETGIIGVGIDDLHEQPYVLEDASLAGSPHEWASAVIALYNKMKADRVIVEVNNGGDMCESVIRMTKGGENIPIRKVHASRGKYTRAEPIAALYEQGRAHHVGFFPELESQMTTYVPGDTSPDRMDALVWAMTELTQNTAVGKIRFL